MPRNAEPITYCCSLCQRDVSKVTRHHLIPKSEGGRETVDLCVACHKTLHAFFTNRTLSAELATIESLRQEPELQAYLGWVRKQADRRISVRTKNQRR
jgi:5-methylcytosine-specific restriction endonuclease McrA